MNDKKTDNERALELQVLTSQGNIKARQELWLLLLPWATKSLKTWCRKLKTFISEEDLYDMSNDVVAKAMEKIDGGETISNFSGFLHFTTSNALRSRASMLKREDKYFSLDDLVDDGKA